MKCVKLLSCLAVLAFVAGCEPPPAKPSGPDPAVSMFQASIDAQNEAFLNLTTDNAEQLQAIQQNNESVLAVSAAVRESNDASLAELRKIASQNEQTQQALRDLAQNLAEAVEPKPTPAPAAPEGSPDVPAKAPTLVLGTAEWCPNCPMQKSLIPALEARGEVVRVLDIDKEPLESARLKIDMLPTWIRLDADGKEIGRIPKAGTDRYTIEEQQELLFGVKPAPAAALPKGPIANRAAPQAPRATARQQRRAARGRG